MHVKQSKHKCDYCGEPFWFPAADKGNPKENIDVFTARKTTVFSIHTVEINSRDVPEVGSLKKFICPTCAAVALTMLFQHLGKYAHPVPPGEMEAGDLIEKLI